MANHTPTFGVAKCDNPLCRSEFVKTGPRQRWCNHECRDDALTRRCIGCQHFRPQSSFHNNSRGGRSSHCIWCEYELGRRTRGKGDAFSQCEAACSRAASRCVRPARWGRVCSVCNEWRPASAYRYMKAGVRSSNCAWCHTTNGSFVRYARRILEPAGYGVCGACLSTISIGKMAFRPTKGGATTHHCPSCKREKHYRNSIKKKYGLELDDVRSMFDEQGGKCAICLAGLDPLTFRSDPNFNDKNFKHRRNMHIDHCHETGTVRGLLCRSCNVNLPAHLDPEWFERAADYLRAA
jgi:hypothetical protein